MILILSILSAYGVLKFGVKRTAMFVVLTAVFYIVYSFLLA